MPIDHSTESAAAADTDGDRTGAGRHTRLLAAIPVTVVLATIAVGMLLALADHWRRGGAVIGLAAGLGAVCRLVLPRWAAGVLAVRSRAFDVIVFAAIFVFLGLVTGVPIATGT